MRVRQRESPRAEGTTRPPQGRSHERGAQCPRGRFGVGQLTTASGPEAFNRIYNAPPYYYYCLRSASAVDPPDPAASRGGLHLLLGALTFEHRAAERRYRDTAYGCVQRAPFTAIRIRGAAVCPSRDPTKDSIRDPGQAPARTERTAGPPRAAAAAGRPARIRRTPNPHANDATPDPRGYRRHPA
jgi:hypothetical protein